MVGPQVYPKPCKNNKKSASLAQNLATNGSNAQEIMRFRQKKVARASNADARSGGAHAASGERCVRCERYCQRRMTTGSGPSRFVRVSSIVGVEFSRRGASNAVRSPKIATGTSGCADEANPIAPAAANVAAAAASELGNPRNTRIATTSGTTTSAATIHALANALRASPASSDSASRMKEVTLPIRETAASCQGRGVSIEFITTVRLQVYECRPTQRRGSRCWAESESVRRYH